MEIRGLVLLPILWVLWTLFGVCVLIALTVISGHQKYPYISSTGIAFPESVIYTVIFLVNSFFGAGIAYIQYRFMIIQSEPSEKRFIICQKILLIAGWIVCIGTAVNAVCSVETHPDTSVYLYKRSFSSRCMCHFRLAAALVKIALLLIFVAGMCTTFFQICSGLCWTIFYMAGTIGEWTGFVGLIMHQLTNYTDFQSLSLKFSREGVTSV
ncbi:DNA damage-regulated autophagy modulator protein 1-like [Anomaloglossus baeobatrachus]